VTLNTMTLPTLFVLMLVAGACLAACQSTPETGTDAARSLNDAPVTTAQPVDAWEGRGTFHHHLSRQNNVYFAGQPDAQAYHDAPNHDVTTVISLRMPPEITPDRLGFDEPALVESLDMRYVCIPFTGESLSTQDADRLAEALSKTPADEAALIHCGSSNRVGALWALYLVRYRNVPIDEAVAQGHAAGLHSDALEQKVRSLAK
jgi:protein tyrosine phosphatase (PTP) superfamily phosphohydrolase (DUF442 family)